MKFIRIVNNCEKSSDKDEEEMYAESEFVQEEIIPVRNLVKVYKFLPETERVIVYVWKCPVTKRIHEFKEKFPSYFLLDERMNQLEKQLTKTQKGV